MTWQGDIRAEIAELFGPLGVPDTSSSMLCEGRVEDSAARAAWGQTREAKRAAKMAADPEYAARRKAQLRAAAARAEAKRRAARRSARRAA